MDTTTLIPITLFASLKPLLLLSLLILTTFIEVLTMEALNFMLDLLVKVASIFSGLAGAFAIFELLKDRHRSRHPITLIRSRVIQMEKPDYSILVLELQNRAQHKVTIRNAIVRQPATYYIDSSKDRAPPTQTSMPSVSNFFTESTEKYPIELEPNITKDVGFKADEKATKAVVLDQADHIFIDTSHGAYKLKIPSNIVLTDGVTFSTPNPKIETKNFVKSKILFAKAYIKYLIQKVIF